MNMLLVAGLLVACLGLMAREVPAGVIQGRLEIPQEAYPDLSPAVLYLEQGRPVRHPLAKPAIVDQEGLQFIPRVQTLRWGGDIILRNSDPELHNVHSSSLVIGFNVAIGPKGEAHLDGKEVRRPGVLPLLCDIHHHMRAYIVVVPGRHFCLSGPNGGYYLGEVPQGDATLHVWQEFCEPLKRPIRIGSGVNRLNFSLRLRQELKAGLVVVARPSVPWGEVVDRVSRSLQRAIQLAGQHGTEAAAEALQAYFDAYFEHFEASELEPAIGRYISGRRVYELEERFDQLRRQLMALSEGGADQNQVEHLRQQLIAAINEDVDRLLKQGIHDKSALEISTEQHAGSLVGSSWVSGPEVSSEKIRQVLRSLHVEFRAIAQLMEAGQSRQAALRLGEAYFNQFHQIEPQLMAQDVLGTTRLEREFSRLRALAGQGKTAEVRNGLLELYRSIEQAAMPRSYWALAFNAFVIILREGVEAILIITAVVTYLIRLGQRQHLRSIYWGVGLALAASAITWSLLQRFVTSAGFARELIEGVAALVAAGVLFYVSYWLISKAEAQRWQRYLVERVRQGVTRRSGWALGATAFLAVYREGAETILMFQPIVGSGGDGRWVALGAVAVGAVCLAAIFALVRWAGMRLPIRPFFQCTGAALFLLAVVFAGKGTAELQEAGILRMTPAAFVPTFPDLGLYPTMQTLLVQGVLVAGALAGLLVMSLSPSSTRGTSDSRDAQSPAPGPTASQHEEAKAS